MDLGIKPWDAAEYLINEDEIAGYLAVVMEEKDLPRMFADTIGIVARARGGFSALAQETGIPEQELLAAAAASSDDGAFPALEKLHRAYANLAAARMVA